MRKLTGGCLCGDVRFEVTGEPDRVGICHCMACRKHHGAAFFAAAVFPAGAVRLQGDTASYQGRVFCPRCGGSVVSYSDDEVEVHLGALDEPNRFVPTYELWTSRREAWLPDFPNTECYARNRSDG
ncbi:GFA family protein [Tateyamaria omphalii]|uniref:Aldehyde-activating protein n=1 Tax=Tateyamaria omphalii TaxID=299262 RepID=A0A1P8MUW6_9RHOB|nr:GFA family protein [Tateyamaria omphalii]APX11811.1 aldehyde-activating protein [Tateyamaria omphalii]